MHPRLARLIFLPTFAWNLLLGRCIKVRRWWDEVEEHVLLGARPLRRDVATLHEKGVTNIINMCDEFTGQTDLYQRFGMEQLWLPTIDFQPPTLAHLVEGVEYIQSTVTRGGRVYVHCKAGRARSAIVVLCWLIKYRQMTPRQAQDWLLKCRPHINPELYKKPVVAEFLAQLESHAVGKTSPSTS